jgi:hypothetical protein
MIDIEKNPPNLEQALDGYVSLREAANRLPSPKAGCRTALSTVYRLIRKHNVPTIRRGSFRFVRWTDIMAIHQEEPGRIEPRRLRRPKTSAWAEAVLDRAGI